MERAHEAPAASVLAEYGAENANDRRYGFLFGHYDSRGGATLVVAARLDLACAEYVGLFGLEPLDRTSESWAWSDPAGDDYEGRYPVLFYGTAPEPNQELLADYSGDDRGCYVEQWLVGSFDNHGAEHETRYALVFAPRGFEVDAVQAAKDAKVYNTWTDEWRLDEANLGEDAWGCVLQYA